MDRNKVFGPGCNHLKYDFMDKIENSWFFRPKPSIYIQLSRNFFFENSTKKPLFLGGGAITGKKPRF